MPELPEVETVKRGLAAVMDGRVLAHVEARRPDLRIPLPEAFAERLTGRRVETVGRRAKYLVIRLSGGLVLLGHLGMSGRMIISPSLRNEPPGCHDHVEFRTEEGVVITYCDPRRFGLMTLCEEEALAAHPLLAGLGPEPLGEDFTPDTLSKALSGKETPIKMALLDQKLVAGLGNIYVSEALFRAGISPKRSAATVAGKRAEKLVPAIKAVLEEAIAAGGSSLRDHRQPSGELGYFQHNFAVYGREGEPCPGCDCDLARTGGIKRMVQAGRSTFYCTKRQR
ncbi:bifunctional DNA-formamidopyrimidine glycosylase/DNA-(apurinic or apyrimidinic site) lyase [Telmatospirillum sp. J64-1]|uniref:bifunctional DNA-formamidopyrimidine glycosylase/DNA-(apurinic or apyrimidinic site) lyase n=1 Tax=Telmatospirillum sp. J64-1 TaxID=2502183 RepID=UPI00115D4FB2|nr:bifunctional DNA-formamidopyrimidine glycosylase/DNA-(apurinic or apyrimidinic site) lyase [Telmatospirillum sp. J64-1]